MNRIADNEMDFNTLEQWCYDMGMAFARKLMVLILGKLDDDILSKRDKSQYRSKGFRTLTLKTLMGEVELPRRLYKTKVQEGTTAHIYLLDQQIGLDTIGTISMGLVSRLGELITESSYRATALAISQLTGQSLSHGGVWNVVQAIGEKLRAIDKRRAETAGENRGAGGKIIKVLQEEFDGVWIGMQGKDRPKKGRKREMKLSCAYEGVRFTGKNKHKKAIYELVNPLYLSGFESAKAFYEKKEGLLSSHYNMDEIQVRLLNGDGGGWVAGFGEKSGDEVHSQLDPFHIQRAIKRSGLSKEEQQKVQTWLKTKEIQSLLQYLRMLYEKEPEEKAKDSKKELYDYLANNQEHLIPIKDRNIKLPELEGELQYGAMGAMESAVCSVIALRMKKRRASFTLEGASNLARMLCLKRSRELDKTIFSLSDMHLPMRFETVVTEVLSAAKVPKKDGSGFHYPINGAMPFGGASTTNGRRAVQYAAGYHRQDENYL